MCFFFSLVPATVFTILGYFVLFTSGMVEGPLQSFGTFLAVWVFLIAGFFPVCGLYVTLSGKCPMEKIMKKLEMPMGKQP